MDDINTISKSHNKKKFKPLTIIEDPHQYHAKPKDLSVNSLDISFESIEESNKNDGKSDHIFSRTPFSSFSLDNRIVELLENPITEGGMGLKSSTNIQSVIIPALLTKRRNILIKSQTGSGKTLSYLVPIINDLITMKPPVQRLEGTRALIIAPTRELCVQITDCLNKLTQCCIWIVAGSITGGEKRKSEKARLRKGIVILGRLLDHLKTTESFNLNNLRWIVLDEADRLLDMGFEQTILDILSTIRGVRLPGLKDPKSIANNDNKSKKVNIQTKWSHQNAVLAKKCSDNNELIHIMASATLTKSLKQLALPIMNAMGDNDINNQKGFVFVDADRQKINDIKSFDELLNFDKDIIRQDGENNGADKFIDFNDDDDDKKENEDKSKEQQLSASNLQKGEVIETPKQLSQYFMMVTCKWRLAALMSFLRTHSHQKTVVFFSTCDSVDYHSLLLRETEWPTDLDSPIEFSSEKSDDSEEKTSNVAASNATPYLDPLDYKFSGMLGAKCPLYRLHGNVPQRVRQNVYRDFCSANSGVLLCTDVAARGLDLPQVDWILQYDPPCETTDYVHRIGRTARKGLYGAALLFLLPSEASYITLLGSHGLNPEPLSLQSLFLSSSKQIPGASKFKNIDEMTAVILQRRIETVVYNNKCLISASKQAFRSFIRAYATHSADSKAIFKVQSLHLGHVAKSFGLRESPAALKSNEDTIGKIFNGIYAKPTIIENPSISSIEESLKREKEDKKRKRDEKYSLSKNIKSKKLNNENTIKTINKSIKKGNDRQKLRNMGKNTTNNNNNLTASGKFRKTNGYFRKKLRAQVTGEFSS